jgi:hypothetical protein
MLTKVLAWAAFIVGVALAVVYGVAGFAAWADAWHVCPDGNQCSDAVDVMLLSAIVLAAGSVVNIIALRIILPRADRSSGATGAPFAWRAPGSHS